MAITAKFEADFSDFNKGVQNAQKSLDSLAKTLLVGVGLRSALRFASDLIEAGAALDTLSQRTGVSVQALQQWANVAEQSGSSVDALAKAAFSLSTQLAGDSKSVAAAVQTLGLNLQALRDMSPEDRFRAVTTALMAMKDPLKQAEVGAALLGKKFDELKPTLSKLGTETSGLITYTQQQTAAMSKMSDAATTAKNSLGPLIVNVIDFGARITSTLSAWQTFFDIMNAVGPPIANADARMREWNKAIDDRMAKPLTLTLEEEKQFIEESNAAVEASVRAFKSAADMRAYYNMIGEREIELVEQQMAAQARADEARQRTEAELRQYYNWVGERQMEDAAKAEEAAARKIAAEEAWGQVLMDTAIKEERARFAAQGVGEAAAAAAPAVDLATGSIISAGNAAQQTAGSFFQMSAGLYQAIRAAQALDELVGRDRNIYGSTISGISGSSASTRWGQASTIVNINGSVLSDPNQIARVVGDAVSSAYRTGGNRWPA